MAAPTVEELLRRLREVEAENQALRAGAAELAVENQALREQVARLTAENRALTERVAQLEAKLAEVTGGDPPGAGRAVPDFVRLRRAQKRRRRKLGRPPGHEGACRPMPERIDRTEDVPPPDRCPRCEVSLLPDGCVYEQIVEEIPRVEPQVVRYCFHGARCPQCRQVYYGHHPDVLPGSPLGMNLTLFVAHAKLALGLSYEKIQQVLREWFGVRVSTGGLARLVQRVGRYLSDVYDELVETIRHAEVVHADETSWPVNGRPQWLWSFSSQDTAVYRIINSRGAQVVEAMLGLGFDGILISDFLGVYNRLDCRKQRCLVHLLRELHRVAEARASPEVLRFVRRLKRLIAEAMELKGRFDQLSTGAYTAAAVRLHQRLDRIIAAPWRDPDCVRLVKRLRKHREELLTFLEYREVEGDNNRAERTIRPAAVLRKISGGSRSPRGARAVEVILSAIQTCRLRGQCFFAYARQAIATYLQTHHVTVGT